MSGSSGAGESLAFLPNGPRGPVLWLFTLLSGLPPMSRGLASGVACPSRCSGVTPSVPVGAVSGSYSEPVSCRSAASASSTLSVSRISAFWSRSSSTSTGSMAWASSEFDHVQTWSRCPGSARSAP